MSYRREATGGRQWRYPTGIGDVKGIELFDCFDSHAALSQVLLHGKPGSGIHGKAGVGAFSVILAGGYEDDEDHGDSVIYTGEGGRCRETGAQIGNQVWKRGNAALQLSLDTGYPVRLIRSSTLDSPCAPVAPEGQSAIYRYDGLYRVIDAELVTGKSGFDVCRFALQRLPGQAPIPVSPILLIAQGTSRSMFSSYGTPTAGPSSTHASHRVGGGRKYSANDGHGFPFKYEGGPTEPGSCPPPGYR